MSNMFRFCGCDQGSPTKSGRGGNFKTTHNDPLRVSKQSQEQQPCLGLLQQLDLLSQKHRWAPWDSSCHQLLQREPQQSLACDALLLQCRHRLLDELVVFQPTIYQHSCHQERYLCFAEALHLLPALGEPVLPAPTNNRAWRVRAPGLRAAVLAPATGQIYNC